MNMNFLHGYLLKTVVLLGLVVGGVVLPVSDCWGQGILDFGTAPGLGAFKDPGVFCEGNPLKVEEPVGNGNIGTVLRSGWMIGNRGILDIEFYRLLASDHGKELKFWIESKCGSDTARITLRVNASIKVNLSSTATICSGETATLTLEVSGGTTPYEYRFNNTTYTNQTAGRTFTVNPATTTSYSVTNLSDAIGCSPITVDGPGGGCSDGTNTYKTVIIGSQEWMAENLKVASNPKCGVSWDNTDPKYGRLYNWEAAMNCAASSFDNPSGVQGLCPAGWHLPSIREWDQLSDYLTAKFPGVGVGTVLKSKEGWDAYAGAGNGTDTVGFCGLPGGYCINDNRDRQGTTTCWWSSVMNIGRVGVRELNYNDTDLSSIVGNSTFGSSVRCLKDEGSTPPTSGITVTAGSITAPSGTVYVGKAFTVASGTAASASKGEVTYSWTVGGTPVPDATGDTLNHTASAAGTYVFVRTATSLLDGTKSATATVSVTVVATPVDGPGGGCTDSDGNTYKTVKIGSQEWMAENLKALPKTGHGNSWDIGIYGRSYDWAAAMDGATTSDKNPSGVQGLCPAGWHLPSDAEWTQLERYLTTKFPGVGVGTVLKSKEGWNSNGDGTDNVGFCGLPGGYYSGGSHGEMGKYGYWWSSTEYNDISKAWRRELHYTELLRTTDGKDVGFTVRCLKD